MKQSTSHTAAPRGWHVAIIMDGNGRWATTRGHARTEGHRAGVDAVRRIVEAAPALGIGTLTLFAFSSANWKRSPAEVRPLFTLIEHYLRAVTGPCVEHGVRLSVIGRRDRLPVGLRAAMQSAEAATAHGRNLHLRLAVDYSSRDALLRAACRMYTATEISPEAFARLLVGVGPDGESAPDVDLLIRTGGEQRLSDFLLWECAYAELYFTRKLWPDFGAADLEAAMRDFHSRERTFGSVPKAAVAS